MRGRRYLPVCRERSGLVGSYTQESAEYAQWSGVLAAKDLQLASEGSCTPGKDCSVWASGPVLGKGRAFSPQGVGTAGRAAAGSGV
jgi:hypothetical protein